MVKQGFDSKFDFICLNLTIHLAVKVKYFRFANFVLNFHYFKMIVLSYYSILGQVKEDHSNSIILILHHFCFLHPLNHLV